jgi:hypothetical protein
MLTHGTHRHHGWEPDGDAVCRASILWRLSKLDSVFQIYVEVLSSSSY